MKRGVILGKFYPPHKGHKFLIETGIAKCGDLTVIVCERAEQDIPGALRAKWLKEIHPEINALVVKDLETKDSKTWAEHVIKWLGFRPDIAFSSENYGAEYEKYLGCEHITVDLERKKFPISGTLIREKPLAYLDYLEPCVREYFLKSSKAND